MSICTVIAQECNGNWVKEQEREREAALKDGCVLADANV